jgi:hypothetical protein
MASGYYFTNIEWVEGVASYLQWNISFHAESDVYLTVSCPSGDIMGNGTSYTKTVSIETDYDLTENIMDMISVNNAEGRRYSFKLVPVNDESIVVIATRTAFTDDTAPALSLYSNKDDGVGVTIGEKATKAGFNVNMDSVFNSPVTVADKLTVSKNGIAVTGASTFSSNVTASGIVKGTYFTASSASGTSSFYKTSVSRAFTQTGASYSSSFAGALTCSKSLSVTGDLSLTGVNASHTIAGTVECKKDVTCDKDLEVTGDLTIGGTAWLDLVYPVGSIYLNGNEIDPADYFGGTWVSMGESDAIYGYVYLRTA